MPGYWTQYVSKTSHTIIFATLNNSHFFNFSTNTYQFSMLHTWLEKHFLVFLFASRYLSVFLFHVLYLSSIYASNLQLFNHIPLTVLNILLGLLSINNEHASPTVVSISS